MYITLQFNADDGKKKYCYDQFTCNYFILEITHNATDIYIRLFMQLSLHLPLKDRAYLSTFKFFIFEKFSCFIVLVVFLVIVQSSELISVWFCEKNDIFFLNFISYHIFAIYVGGASLGLPTACRLIAVSGARLPSADGLFVRCIKCTTMLNLSSQYVCDLFQTDLRYISVYQHTEAPPLCLCRQKAPSSGIYVNRININPSMDK